MKKNPLIELGNVPVQTGTLKGIFSDYSAKEMKISALERDGQLIRLKRGLYVVSSDVTGKQTDIRICANHIYSPSYISLQWALRWYGLIPEHVVTVTSVTTNATKLFKNSLGYFSYRKVADSYFPIGIRNVVDNGIGFLIARPEKALCDLILADSYLPSRSFTGLATYLEEDIRFDMDALKDFDVSIIEECLNADRKTTILSNLIKMIKR